MDDCAVVPAEDVKERWGTWVCLSDPTLPEIEPGQFHQPRKSCARISPRRRRAVTTGFAGISGAKSRAPTPSDGCPTASGRWPTANGSRHEGVAASLRGAAAADARVRPRRPPPATQSKGQRKTRLYGSACRLLQDGSHAGEYPSRRDQGSRPPAATPWFSARPRCPGPALGTRSYKTFFLPCSRIMAAAPIRHEDSTATPPKPSATAAPAAWKSARPAAPRPTRFPHPPR
jgi:hypothetical protein